MRHSTTFMSPRKETFQLRQTVEGSFQSQRREKNLLNSSINMFTKSPRLDSSSQALGSQTSRFSNNLVCLVLSMLTESTESRPDFLELQFLLKDLQRMHNCDHFLSNIISTRSKDRVEDSIPLSC